MKAAWYQRQGPPDVLVVGERDASLPGPGEVRVNLRVSALNPGDVKKRQGWLGSSMPYPLVIPHSDGAGTIELTGPGVDASRIGRRVWVYGAQSYRPFGTAAQTVVVPEHLAVDLPDSVSLDVGASLGIPGITAHRAVFGDGDVAGKIILVHGVGGAVGSFAAQLAHWAGAAVIGTVRRSSDLAPTLDRLPFSAVVALDTHDGAHQIRDHAPEGIERIVEVSLSANVELDSQVVAPNAVIACYGSASERPVLPFWTLLFENVTLRLLGSDDFPAAAKAQAATELTAAAADGGLRPVIARRFPLDDIADAHSYMDQPHDGRVLIDVG